MDKSEIVLIFDEFINDKGLWFEFKDWLESRGYNPKELGFDE